MGAYQICRPGEYQHLGCKHAYRTFALPSRSRLPYEIIRHIERGYPALGRDWLYGPSAQPVCCGTEGPEPDTQQSGRSENGVSFLTYFRFPSSHTTVRAVRHTAVSCLSCPFWTPHIGHRHFFSIVGIRPIVLKREFLFGHLTTTVSKYTDCLVRQCTIRPFALTVTRSATSASADSSTFVVTILADCRGLAG